MTSNQIAQRVLKPAVFLAGLVPAAILVYLTRAALAGNRSAWPALTGNFSANPLADITDETGICALRFLCITLAITPLRRLTGWNGVIRFRRMLGLYAFFYGTLHFLTYIILDRAAGLDYPHGIVSWTTVMGLTASIGGDIYKRPFITIGFTAFVSLLPLAVTSTAGMVRRLGGRRWKALHRLIYLAAPLVVLHYWWLVKADTRSPLIYGAIVAMLLAFRVYWAWLRTAPSTARRVASAEP